MDELNKELLDNAEGDDSISKESGAIMVEEIKAAAEEIDCGRCVHSKDC